MEGGGGGRSAALKRSVDFSVQESDRRSLRARGLCLVPLPCALRLARSNGADIWAPNMTNSRDG